MLSPNLRSLMGWLFAGKRPAARAAVRPLARLGLEGMEERLTPVSLPFNPQQVVAQLALPARPPLPSLPSLANLVSRLNTGALQHAIRSLPYQQLQSLVNRLPAASVPHLTARLPVATLQSALDRLRDKVDSLPVEVSDLARGQLQQLINSLPAGQFQQALSQAAPPQLRQVFPALPRPQLQGLIQRLPVGQLQSLISRLPAGAQAQLTNALDTLFSRFTTLQDAYLSLTHR